MIEKWMDFFSVPQEIDWMLSLAAGDLQTPLMEGMDWQRFAELVSKNRLEPLVAVGIKKLPQETVRRIPGSETYAKVKNSLALLSMRQIQTLACVMSDFAAHGIRALSFKGPLLALDLYGNPELRYSHDLDILIARTDFPKACERLEANGFQEEITVLNKTEKRRRKVEDPMGIIHTRFFRGDLCIELHWKISHRIAESFDAFWERCSQKKLLGQTIHCLGDLDNISYLICHAAGHGYMRMRWLVDLYILLQRPDLNWLALYQDMKRKGIQEMLLETLFLLYRCPRFAMPPVDNSLFSIGREDGRVRFRYREDLQEDYEHALALAETVWPMMLMTDEERQRSSQSRKYGVLLPVDGKRQSWLEILISFFRPGEVDFKRFDFPDSLYFLYYVVRPFYRVWRMTPFYHPQE